MSSLVLQGGDDAVAGARDPKLGIVSIRLKCWAPDIISALRGTLPDFGITNLVEWKPRTFSNVTSGTADGYHVLANLEGHEFPDQAEGEDYSLEGTLGDDPIEGNPNYITLLDVYEGKENPATGRGEWKTKLANGERNTMHGVENYRAARCIWTRKWVSQFIPAGIVRTLGSLDHPPGNPPELNGNRNWLLIRVRALHRGNIWQMEASWEESGPYGWVPEAYRYY